MIFNTLFVQYLTPYSRQEIDDSAYTLTMGPDPESQSIVGNQIQLHKNSLSLIQVKLIPKFLEAIANLSPI